MNTVGEAIALGTLLRWVMQYQGRWDMAMPTAQEARDAAVLLATKAAKTGACSVSSAEIAEFFPKRRLRMVTPEALPVCHFCRKDVDSSRLFVSIGINPAHICAECVVVLSTMLYQQPTTTAADKASLERMLSGFRKSRNELKGAKG